MKRLNNIFFFFLSLILIFGSCKEKELQYLAEELTILDTIVVSTPPEMRQPKLWHTNQVQGVDYLIKGDNINGQLRIYPLNLAKEAYEPTLIIESDGPNGFNSNLAHFYVHNFDSIFVFPNTTAKILIYNRNGEIQNVIKYGTYKNESFEDLYGNSTLSIDQSGIYFNSVAYLNPGRKDFLEELKPVQYYDFGEGELKALTRYPQQTHNKFLPIQFVGAKSLLCFDSLLITNFIFDENLYAHSVRNGSEKPFKAAIPFNHIRTSDEPYSDVNAVLASLSYPYYDGLFYDKNRASIFRLVRFLKKSHLTNSPELLERVANGETDFLGNALIQIGEDLRIQRIIDVPTRKYFVFTGEGLLVEDASVNEIEGQERYIRYQLE